MSGILATSPIMAGVSYQTAAELSAVTQATEQAEAEAAQFEGAGDTYVTYEQHLHSPKPLDSVTVYRGSKSLLSLKKEELAS
jgi:hypothetical protein